MRSVDGLVWQVHGQDHILRQLGSSLAQGRLAHAYLLVGPRHVGKMTLAINLAQAVNCQSGMGEPCADCAQCQRIAKGQHPDVRVVAPGYATGYSNEGRANRTVIGIDDVKEVLRSVNLNPFEGARSVIIVDGAEGMSVEAANALLKTLEEPPPLVMFLLLASDADLLLPTIRSRCQVFGLLPLARPVMLERLINEHQTTEADAERLFRYSRGCLGWALRALTDHQVLEQRQADVERMEETLEAGLETRFAYANEVATLFGSDRETARELLFLWLRWWRDLLLIKEGAEEFLRNIDQLEVLRNQAIGLSTPQIVGFIKCLVATIDALDRNAGARLALECLMLNLPIEAART